QIVRGRGEQLEQHYPDVGLAALGPRGEARRDEVEQSLAEAGVVLREVVDDDRRLGLGRWLVRRGPAVEWIVAGEPKAQLAAGEERIDVGSVDRQRVDRKVALAVELE